MQHYKVEQRSIGNIESSYFHSPGDSAQSVEDYFEDMLSQGYEFVCMADHANGAYWTFKVVAK